MYLNHIKKERKLLNIFFKINDKNIVGFSSFI